MLRSLMVCLVLLLAGACSGLTELADQRSIAGQYNLVTVDGSPLPCCGQADSAGTRVTVLAGTLALSEAQPEKFVSTPGGSTPKSCIQEIPNGAHVDTSGVVTLPDSTKYQLPQCGNGTYQLVLTQRYDYADGRSDTRSLTSSGRYAWSNDEPNLVAILGASLAGPITTSESGTGLTLQRRFAAPPVAQPPQYEFVRATQRHN